MAVNKVSGVLDLCDHAVLSHDRRVQIASERHNRTRCCRGFHDVVSPGGRLFRTKKDGTVNLLSEGLLDSRTHFSPDVIFSIIENRFRDRNDHGDLLSRNNLFVPGLVSSFLLAGVPIDKVGNGQHVKHRHPVLPGRHILQPAPPGENRRLGDYSLDNFIGLLHRDQCISPCPVDRSRIGFKNMKIHQFSVIHSHSSLTSGSASNQIIDTCVFTFGTSLSS